MAEDFREKANEWMTRSKFWQNSPSPFGEEVIDIPPIRDVEAPLATQSHPVQGKTTTDAAVAVTKALRGMNMIDEAHLIDGQVDEWQHVLARASENRMVLIRRAELLAIALENHPTPPNPAFHVSLLHLMETEGFLGLSHDGREKCLAGLYTIIRRGNTRIVHSTEELMALRSGRDACPNKIAELNALIEDGKRKSA